MSVTYYEDRDGYESELTVQKFKRKLTSWDLRKVSLINYALMQLSINGRQKLIDIAHGLLRDRNMKHDAIVQDAQSR